MQKKIILLTCCILIVVVIACVALCYHKVAYFGSSTVRAGQFSVPFQNHAYTYQIVNSRNRFINSYTVAPQFIEDYLIKSPVVKLSNTTPQSITLDLNKALYSWLRIDEELSPVNQDQDGAIKLFNFMKRKIHLTEFANYENSQNVSYPPLYLSFFSSGKFSTAASDLALLAFHFKFKARIVHLTNHVVTEIYYNDAWHMFDLEYAGYIMDEENTIISANQVKEKAAKQYFPDKSYNVAFSTIRYKEDATQELMNKAAVNFTFSLLPNESLNFYTNLWMLTTDGINLEHKSMKNPASFLQMHSAKIANFVREIPLTSLSAEQLKLADFTSIFPLAGAFIVYPQQENVIRESTLPQVLLQTNKLHPDYEDSRYLMPSRYYVYEDTVTISLSEFLLQLEKDYSTSIKIANLGKTLEYNPNSRLLLVYQYVPSNVAWGKLLLEGHDKKMNTQYNFDGTGLIH